MTDKIRGSILKVRETGKTNMFDINTVQKIAYEMELYELVNYLEKNKEEYIKIGRASCRERV